MFENNKAQSEIESSREKKFLIINSVLLEPITASRSRVDRPLILKKIEEGIYSVLKDGKQIPKYLDKLTSEHGYSIVLYSNRKEHQIMHTLAELDRACRLEGMKRFPKISAIVVKDRASYPQIKASELKVAENSSHEMLVAGYSLQPQQETEILEGISKLINLNDSALNNCIVVDSRSCFLTKAKQEGWNVRDAGSVSLKQILWDLYQEAAKKKEDDLNHQLLLNEAKGLTKEAANQEIAVPLTPFISDLEFESLHKPSPGGSSFTRAFTDKESKSEWIGKCSEQAVQSQNEYDEYREYLASQLYELLRVKVPKTLLSRQYFEEKIQKGELWRRCKGALQPRLHILSQVVPGFELLGKDFVQYYKRSSEKNKKEPFCIGEGMVPLKGFGRMMAVAILTQDYSFIGDPGRNIGYLPKENGKYFEILKIDLGEALETEENEDIHKPLSKQDAVFGTLKERISYNELNEIDQKEFVQTLKEMLEIKHCTFEKMFSPFVKLDVRFRRAFEEFLNRRQQFLFAFASEVRNLITVQIEELEKQQSEKHDINLEKSPTTTIEMQAHEIEGLKKYVSAPVSSIEVNQSANQLSKELIELAGELPLAHSLAAAYMQQKGMSISEFCSFISKESSTESILLQTQDKEKELESIEDSSEFKSLNFVTKLLALTLEDLRLKNPHVKTLLDILAYLSPNEISTNMLQELWSSCQSKERLVDSHIQRIDESWKELLHYERTHERECSIEAFNDALKLLLSYSIITADPFQNQSKEKEAMSPEDISDMKISIHHLTQQLIRLYHRSVGKYESCYADVLNWMAKKLVYDERDPHDIRRVDLLVHHAIYLEALPNTIKDLVMAEFQEKIGNHQFYGAGKYDVTIKYYEKAMIFKEKIYGNDHPEIAIILGHLGNAWGCLRNFQKQIDILTRSLAIFEKHYDDDHPQIAATLSNLGTAWGSLGNFQKQIDLQTRALEISEKCYGKDHPQIAITLSTLGNAWGCLRDVKKQIDLQTRAVGILEKNFGNDHLQVGDTLYNLGNAWGATGDFQKQREFLTRALAIFEKCYGKDHPQTGGTLRRLGDAWRALGDVQKQKELLTQALAIFEKCYGMDHLQVGLTLGGLGNAWGCLRDVKKQIDLQSRALGILEKNFGNDHLQVAALLTELGNAFGSLGEFQKQKDILTRALQIFEKQLGNVHPHIGVILNQLGIASGKLRDHEKKKNLLTRALAIFEKQYGPFHSQVAMTLSNLANAWGSLGNLKEQIDLLTRALAIFDKHPGKNNHQLCETLIELGNVWGSFGDHKKQKDFLTRALEIKEKTFGKDHIEVARILGNLGVAWEELGDSEKQIDVLTRALPIFEKYRGIDDLSTSAILSSLGRAWGLLEDFQKQKDFLTRAVEIKEKILGKYHPDTAVTLNFLGNAWGKLGDFQKQKEFLTQVLESFEKLSVKNHLQIGTVLANLGSAWKALGDAEKEKDILTRALEELEMHYGKDHPQIAVVLGSLGNAWGALGDFEKQKDVLTRALEIFEKCCGKDHPQVGATLLNLGSVWGKLGNHEKMKEFVIRALEIKEKHVGEDHLEIAITLALLGDALEELGEYEKQKDVLIRALPIFEKHHGKDHPDVCVILKDLGRAWESLGDHEKKKEIITRLLEIKNKKDTLENRDNLNGHLNQK